MAKNNYYNKFKDIANIKEMEVRLSAVFTVFLLIVLWLLRLHDEFTSFIETIDGIISCFIGGYLGLIGFALSGMAIMLGLFSKKQIDIIEKYNGSGVIESIMSSYYFLALISGINIIILIIIEFAINSNLPIIPAPIFWVVTMLTIYLSLFSIFYTVALVFNCISLFTVYKLYSTEKQEELLPVANEIRIDYILDVLVNVFKLTRDDILNGLESESTNLSDEERKQLREYFDKYYADGKKE